jgi:hypothetical protein
MLHAGSGSTAPAFTSVAPRRRRASIVVAERAGVPSASRRRRARAHDGGRCCRRRLGRIGLVGRGLFAGCRPQPGADVGVGIAGSPRRPRAERWRQRQAPGAGVRIGHTGRRRRHHDHQHAASKAAAMRSAR